MKFNEVTNTSTIENTINCTNNTYPDFVVGDSGILHNVSNRLYETIIPKEVFIEAFNKWCKQGT